MTNCLILLDYKQVTIKWIWIIFPYLVKEYHLYVISISYLFSLLCFEVPLK